jgi:hypothetical protein
MCAHNPINVVLNTTPDNMLQITQVMIESIAMPMPKITSIVDELITAIYSDIDRKIENTVEGLSFACCIFESAGSNITRNS